MEYTGLYTKQNNVLSEGSVIHTVVNNPQYGIGHQGWDGWLNHIIQGLCAVPTLID